MEVCDLFTRSNCTQRFFLGNRLRFLCGNDTLVVAMHFAMKNGQICFSLQKFLAISPAIQKIASDCGCDAVVHLGANRLSGCIPGAVSSLAELLHLHLENNRMSCSIPGAMASLRKLLDLWLHNNRLLRCEMMEAFFVPRFVAKICSDRPDL